LRKQNKSSDKYPQEKYFLKTCLFKINKEALRPLNFTEEENLLPQGTILKMLTTTSWSHLKVQRLIIQNWNYKKVKEHKRLDLNIVIMFLSKSQQISTSDTILK